LPASSSAAATAAGASAPKRQLFEVLVCGFLAAAFSALVVLGVPRGGDLAAHLYRTGLVRHGVLVWDNLWFAGQYPLSSYSLLYYLFAAVIGNAALGIAGVAVAAAIFASVAQREWDTVGPWPARVFAVVLAGQAFTAAYPYDMGLATLLATLWALQRGRLWLAACCIVLTLGFSPLAFVLLALALLALFLRRPRVDRRAVVVAVVGLLAAGAELAILRTLPTPGLVYPYGTWRLLVGLAVAALGAALSIRGRGGWALASLFLVWAAATILAYLIPSPVGHNLVRASVFVVSLVLVAAALAGFRPRWLTVAAIASAFAANVLPYTAMIPDRSSSVDAQAAFWQPVVRFLHAHSGPNYRVEVVPTANHWEAYFLPHAGLPLARGWYRQLDIADDAALYARRLTGTTYRAWLRAHAVRYVVLPHLSPEAIDGHREATLIASGAAGLREVASSPAARIYELSHPKPMLSGPAAAAVTALRSDEIDGWVARPGSYLLRVHYTPYWSVVYGSLCLGRAGGKMTRLEAAHAGPFAIRAIETPAGVLAALLEGDARRCAVRNAASARSAISLHRGRGTGIPVAMPDAG
jgi:hypothetical protein